MAPDNSINWTRQFNTLLVLAIFVVVSLLLWRLYPPLIGLVTLCWFAVGADWLQGSGIYRQANESTQAPKWFKILYVCAITAFWIIPFAAEMDKFEPKIPGPR